VSDKKVLKKIFGARRDAVTRERRKLHNEGLKVSTPHPILLG
jgi:hypothetical protein